MHYTGGFTMSSKEQSQHDQIFSGAKDFAHLYDEVVADLAASRAEGASHSRWMAISKFLLDLKLIETRLMVDLLRLATGRGKDDENDLRKSS
jgi:hypothetical protein